MKRTFVAGLIAGLVVLAAIGYGILHSDKTRFANKAAAKVESTAPQ
jgi:hypothetical protein